MGQGLSCRASDEHGLFTAVQCGDLETVEVVLKKAPSLIQHASVYDRNSAMHIAAANGQIEVGSSLPFGCFFSLIWCFPFLLFLIEVLLCWLFRFFLCF